YMQYRNTWQWNRQQFAGLSDAGKTNVSSLSSNDYRLGILKNWLHKPVIDSQPLKVGRTLNMQREAAAGASAADGQKTWYGYYGKAHYQNEECTISVPG